MEEIIIYKNADSQFSQIWLHERRMTIFVAKGRYTRDLVAAWGKTVITTAEAWPHGQTYYAIHDNSQAQNVFTPMVREWIDKITYASQKLKGYYAVVLDNSFGSRMFKLIVESQLRRRLPNLQSKVFFKREDALQWLEAHLHE